MPNRTKKEHKCSHHTEGSRWQNFHFSGKLIVCSVIFGFMLILIGGIVYAIGMDRDDDTKSDDYEDLQKKPPMAIVGPVMMGIGGFIVLVGIGMCLVETNVCRRRTVETNPLIDEESGPKDSEATGIENGSNAIPSNSRRNGNRKKSPSPRRNKLRAKKTKDKNSESISPKSPSSAPIDVGSSQNYLSASDKFLTPPNSFVRNNSRDAENQTSSSLMKSFTTSSNSWTTSTEFQTPNASSLEDSMILESRKLRQGQQGMLDPTTSIINSHEFLTPKNSEMIMPSEMKECILNQSTDSEASISNIPDQKKIEGQQKMLEPSISNINSHEFLTPKNSEVIAPSEINDCVPSHTDSEDLTSINLDQKCCETIDKLETQLNKNENIQVSVADVLITASVKEVSDKNTEKLDDECNCESNVTKKKNEPLSNKEREDKIESVADESFSKSLQAISDSDNITKHVEEKLSSVPLELKIENNYKHSDFVKEEPGEQSQGDNTHIQDLNVDKNDLNEIELKETKQIESKLEESDLSLKIVDESAIQVTNNDFQDNELTSEDVELVQNVMEIESINDANEDLGKSLSSLNNNET